MHRVTRRWWLVASFGAPLLVGLTAPALQLCVDGDDLRVVAAPKLHFLSDKPLEKLKDGATLVFLAQFSLSTEVNAPAIQRAVNRFVVSYDVWEEKFSVTSTGLERATVSHLSASAAETWCLDHLALNIDGIAPDTPVWVKLELRAEDARDQAAVVGQSGISIARLIDVFSNPARAQQMHWGPAVAGPVRLLDIKRERRSPRSG
jgi:hypothetical protein